MVRDFAKRLYEGNSGQTSGGMATGGLPYGTLTDIRLHLDQPIYGEVNGQAVTIIGEGNRVGFSPVSWVVDKSRENAWLPTDAILITDPRFEPVEFVRKQAA